MILIVGDTGFIGVNLKSYFVANKIEFTTLSLRNGIPVQIPDNITIVIYLVGKSYDTKRTEDYNLYKFINVDLVDQFYRVFLKSRAKKFIFVSSIKAVADTSLNPLTELAVPSPISVYGKSKLEAENRLLELSKSSDKDLFILRPTMVHGAYNKGNLNTLYKFVKFGLPYPFAEINNKRSMLSIDNFSFVVHEICKDNVRPGIYHLCDNEFVSTIDIVRIIEDVLNSRIIKFQIPDILLELISLLPGGKGICNKVDKLIESFLVSNKKIVEEIGRDLPIDAKSGLYKTINSFKK